MIDISLTEKRIAQEIEALLQPGSTTPAFKLNVYPGSLEELGKPMRCSHVVLQFKKIEFENVDKNSFQQCKVVQRNVVYFSILVQNNNLRTHVEVYAIAQDIIKQIRGQCLLVNDTDSLIQGTNPFRVAEFRFSSDIKNGGVCYQSYIEISSTFTDIYDEC